jgi:hypothetical protein
MPRELPRGTGAGETLPPGGAAAVDDRTAVLRGHAGQKAELADATLLGWLESTFHGDFG